MKLLPSAGKVEHSFFRFFLASKFSFFLFFFFNEMNRSKQGASHTCHYKKKTGGGKLYVFEKDCVARKKIDFIVTYFISCLPMILFGFAIRCLKE